MSEFSRQHGPIPDVLRPPDYFREREITEANHLIDHLLTPSHIRVGSLPEREDQEKVVRADGTVGLVRVRQMDPEESESDSYVKRFGFHSTIDTLRAPFGGLTYGITHETSHVVGKYALPKESLNHIYTVFEAQYRNGYITVADFNDICAAEQVVINERHHYSLRHDALAVRSFSVSAKIRHQPQDESELPEYSSATLMLMNGQSAHNFPEHRSLPVLDEEVTEGLLTGDTEHEKRLISVLLDLELVSEQEVKRYAGVA